MNITIIFKDGSSVRLENVYQIANDGDEITFNYESWQEVGNMSMSTTNSATFDSTDICYIAKGIVERAVEV